MNGIDCFWIIECFLEYRWLNSHKDFVKYALKYCIILISENAMEEIVKFILNIICIYKKYNSSLNSPPTTVAGTKESCYNEPKQIKTARGMLHK